MRPYLVIYLDFGDCVAGSNFLFKVAQEFERQKTHLKRLFAVELLNGILLHRENASLKLNIPVRKILYCKQMNM